MADHDSSIAAGAGTIDVGGDLTVGRLGFGAMRDHRPGDLGRPARSRRGARRAAAGRRARRRLHRHRRLVRPATSASNCSPRRCTRIRTNLVIATKGGLERPGPGRWTPNGRPDYLRKACEGSLRRLRLEQIPLLPVPPARPPGSPRGLHRRARRAQGRGQGPPHRTVQRHRGAAPAGPAADADRVDPEPLQPHRPWLGVARRPVRTGTHRVHPVGPDPGSRGRRPGGRDRRPAQRHGPAGRPRLAARPLRRRCSSSQARRRDSISMTTSLLPVCS